MYIFELDKSIIFLDVKLILKIDVFIRILTKYFKIILNSVKNPPAKPLDFY